MNKVFLIFVYFCLIIGPLKIVANTVNTVEFRSAAFFHQSKKFQHIYKPVSADFQIEGTYALNCSFELWSELDYMEKSKKKDCYHTKIQLTNFSLGAQYVRNLCAKLDLYVGIGASMVRIDLNDKSCCGNEKESKIAWGLLAKTGVRYWFANHWFFDVFADYLYQEVHFKKNVNVGGFKTGVGIGFSF